MLYTSKYIPGYLNNCW